MQPTSPPWRTRSSSGRLVAVLNAIYEEDFLGFSYGFRAKARHSTMRWMLLLSGSTSKKVNCILDADIRSFFDSKSAKHGWFVSCSIGLATDA